MIALFAGLGLLAPAGVLFIGGYLNWGGDWLIVFWPTALMLIGDTFRPPTGFEVISGWAVAIGINVLLYAIVGTVVWRAVTHGRNQIRTLPICYTSAHAECTGERTGLRSAIGGTSNARLRAPLSPARRFDNSGSMKSRHSCFSLCYRTEHFRCQEINLI